MGKRVNKTTKFTVDISKALHDNGLPTTLMLELSMRVKHPKQLEGVTGHFSKQVVIDFTKVGQDEAVSS